MIDIHSHLIPAFDDGSRNIEITQEKLIRISESGVTDLIFTPHYYPELFTFDQSDLKTKYDLLVSFVKKNNLTINLHLGSEVFLTSGIEKTIENLNLTLSDSNYVLVESNLRQFPKDLFQILYDLRSSGCRLILAHPERYQNVIENPEIANELMHKDIYLQLNAGSFFNFYGNSSCKTAWYLLNNGYAHVVASDDHADLPEYILPKAFNLIKNEIDEYTANLLFKINPAKLLKNETIEMFYVKIFQERSNNSKLKKILNKIMGRV